VPSRQPRQPAYGIMEIGVATTWPKLRYAQPPNMPCGDFVF
jgi:hypothetical protein